MPDPVPYEELHAIVADAIKYVPEGVEVKAAAHEVLMRLRSDGRVPIPASIPERRLAELRALPIAVARERVNAALSKQRERAEDSPGHAGLLVLHERWVEGHQPSSDVPATTCVACREQWPCGVIAGVVASG